LAIGLGDITLNNIALGVLGDIVLGNMTQRKRYTRRPASRGHHAQQQR
jgi:hypothetical protein